MFSSTMKSFVGVAAILCLAVVDNAQFRFPGFGGAPRRPASPPRGVFQAGGGGGGCTPTPNHQFGGKSYWVGWRGCGTEFRADQVPFKNQFNLKISLIVDFFNVGHLNGL